MRKIVASFLAFSFLAAFAVACTPSSTPNAETPEPRALKEAEISVRERRVRRGAGHLRGRLRSFFVTPAKFRRSV